jgi:hypothetical protein
MAKQTHVNAQNGKGQSVQLLHHETDSPILPVPQLEQLHAFRPDLVDWVKDQTQLEAESRRARTSRLDTLIFIERIAGVMAGTAIAALGLGCATYLAINNQPWAASIIGGGTLAAIVSVLVTGRKQQ